MAMAGDGRLERWVGVLFCTPAIVLLLFAVVIPFLVAFGITFTDQRLLSPNPTRFVGLENYARLLSVWLVEIPQRVAEDGGAGFARLREVLRADPDLRGYRALVTFDAAGGRYALVARDPVFWRSLLNTFLFVALVIPLQCGAALALAMLVNHGLRGRGLFRTLYFAPVVTSMVVVSIVWSFLYNPTAGIAALFGLEGVDWLGSERLALPAIVVMSAWQGAGFQMLIFLAGLQGINPDLYEAADMDGANRWQQFRHVTLPGLRNTTIFVAISTTIAAFGLFTQVDVMTQGGPNDATSTLIFHAVRTGFREQDVAYGSTVAVVFFVLVLTVALVQKRVSEAGEEEA